MIAPSALALALLSPSHAPSCPCRYPLEDPPQEARPFAEWPDNRAHEPHGSEVHLRNLRQLTFGGQNAEAYWDVSGRKLTFQTSQPAWPDEQIVTMNADGSDKRLVSTGKGRCTCSYFTPDAQWVYFSSTHERNPGPQKRLDMSKGYVWMVNPEMELYRREVATGALEKVLSKPGYVAETTIAPNGRFMVFTGAWEGNIDIYRSDLTGRDVRRLTTEFGYNGGPFVSWDSKKVVYRRGPLVKTEEERKEFSELLAQNLVRPNRMDIWVMDADGRNKRQVTRLPGSSFAPFMHPDGKRIAFSSNWEDPKGREFDLYIVNLDGTGLKRVTHTPDFDGFPMFTRDGKRLVWASNRHGAVPRETNVFVADWVE